MLVPTDSQSIHSTVHGFDPEVDTDAPGPSADPFLVRFSPGDRENPMVRSSRSLTPFSLTHPP